MRSSRSRAELDLFLFEYHWEGATHIRQEIVPAVVMEI